MAVEEHRLYEEYHTHKTEAQLSSVAPQSGLADSVVLYEHFCLLFRDMSISISSSSFSYHHHHYHIIIVIILRRCIK